MGEGLGHQEGSQGLWSAGACRPSLHPTGRFGTAWPRTAELSQLQPKTLQKLTCKTEYCFLEWRPGEVTRDVLCLSGCLSVCPTIRLSVCLSVLGCCRPSIPIPVCGPCLAYSFFMHTCVRGTRREELSWLCKDNSLRRGALRKPLAEGKQKTQQGSAG